MQIPIRGMTCNNCASHVAKAIQKVPGVTGVKVDLAAGVANVDGSPDLEVLARAVAEEGYQAVLK